MLSNERLWLGVRLMPSNGRLWLGVRLMLTNERLARCASYAK